MGPSVDPSAGNECARVKIATWNCNSIRARTARLLPWLSVNQPDVLCLQELKCTDEDFPWDAVKEAGYQAACFGQRTYNGVAILAKSELTNVTKGLGDDVEDPQSRVVAATVNGVRIISVYAPNGQALGSPAYQYKLAWYERLKKALERVHRPGELLVVCGDFNVAPEPIDVHDPRAWEGQTLFSIPEREALKSLCGFGLVDLYRKHHPTETKFSWWDYRMLAFPKNRGLRIDHLLGTIPLAERSVACDIDREARKGAQPSDHAPVWGDFQI
jgi:exodeoxyribonuclease-3